ncbi:MAG: hypothetical protein EBU46_10865 [Nitrosomonadaceae bacterium]|jgi:hypothetical protein|nr:hypothetical protein [Nitrosomonadaceae bacterium]
MAAIPNDVREGIEAAITRGLQDEVSSVNSEKKRREEFFAGLPAWIAQCHRQDYENDTLMEIQSATFSLPGGEIILIKRSYRGITAGYYYRYWIKKESKYGRADTLDHAIFCATELTRQEMLEKAKLLLDAQEEQA